MAEKDGILEEFANWGGGTEDGASGQCRAARPRKDQHDPDNPGLDPGKAYRPAPGDNNNGIGPDAPGGPVNIRVKGAAGDAPGQPDELAKPDDGVTDETRAKTTGMGKAGV